MILKSTITTVNEVFSNLSKLTGKEIIISGWVKSIRDMKNIVFININDGSTDNIQCIIKKEAVSKETISKLSILSIGSGLVAKGTIIESKGDQEFEFKISEIIFSSKSAENYPLQKKSHSVEFIRSLAHLRSKTSTFAATMRIRNAICKYTHDFFQGIGCKYVGTPIITSMDCEGAGEMFEVSSGVLGPERKFFGKDAFLTVSGQLHGECMAFGLSDIYTFGPTFRSENSHTGKHLSEFWMTEPEISFCDIDDLVDIAERYIKYVFSKTLEECRRDIKITSKEDDHIKYLEKVISDKFIQITYTEAVDLVNSSDAEEKVTWGDDLNSSCEKIITTHFNSPVIIRNYPKALKPFYMKQNSDGKTVAGMDVILPIIGEVIGGSQREENFDALMSAIPSGDIENYQWYLDTRKYGGVPHSGFGAGIERLVVAVSGIKNIRDTIPFPRYPGTLSY